MINSTFVVIMGAGRCGSTFTLNCINSKLSNANVYGEDAGATLSLLHLLYNITVFETHLAAHPRKDFSAKFVSPNIIEDHINKKIPYIGNEMYCDKQFFFNLKTILVKELIEHFNSPITGFKEIRWDMFDNLNFLNVLYSYYTSVKFIFLTRDFEETVSSAANLWKTESKEKIKARITNKLVKIEKFINTQPTENILVTDVFSNKSFQDQLFGFLTL